MTEFTKTKMHFALAMLGTLFALHNLLDKIEEWSFTYLDFEVKVLYAYAFISGLLAFTVYCYALALLTERPSSRWEKLGNYCYALAILTVPLYGALYLSSLLAEKIGESHLAVTAPSAAAGLGIGWLVISQILAWRLRKRLGDRDRQEKIEQLVDQEIVALDRAPELFESHHYDLAVIEAWKAIEARLRRVLLARGYTQKMESAQRLIDLATRKGIVKDTNLKLLQEVRHEWGIAVSTEPLGKTEAETALSAARHILATIPVEPPA